MNQSSPHGTFMKYIRKPTCTVAMQALIQEIRSTIPFGIPVSVLCSGVCHGCSKKLIDYLENEIIQWEAVIDQCDEIKLGDISKLANTSKKIYKILQKNGHIPKPD
jgi:hypothetical protein